MTVFAHTINDIKSITDSFARATRLFGLTISLKETDVMFQPKPGTNHVPPNITIDNVHLKVMDKFTYLGSTLSENAMIGDQISARLGKARTSFGGLTTRSWNKRGVCLSTKIPLNTWETIATIRPLWCHICRTGLQDFEQKQLQIIKNQRTHRKNDNLRRDLR